jgi:hypothetical protein
MHHDAATLRAILEEIQTFPEASKRSAAELHHLFRDCRLEIARLGSVPLSENQAHRLQQLDYRLDMVACRQAVPESVGPEAKRALEAFGWRQEFSESD